MFMHLTTKPQEHDYSTEKNGSLAVYGYANRRVFINYGLVVENPRAARK